MEIVLRDAKPDDLSMINDLMRVSKAHWGYDEPFLDRFMEIFSITEEYLDESTTKLAYDTSELIGFFSFIHKEGCFELDNLFLHPDHIGKGMGNKLWKLVCETSQNYKQMEFIIMSDPNAEQFYVKMGAEKIGLRPSPMNRHVPVLKYKIKCTRGENDERST